LLSDVFGWFSGSAVVMCDQTSVSTIGRNEYGDELTIYNAIRGGGGSPGWQEAGTTLYAPIFKRNWYGLYSQIRLLNVGWSDGTIYAHFYERDSGTYRGYLKISDLAPNARHTLSWFAGCSLGGQE